MGYPASSWMAAAGWVWGYEFERFFLFAAVALCRGDAAKGNEPAAEGKWCRLALGEDGRHMKEMSSNASERYEAVNLRGIL